MRTITLLAILLLAANTAYAQGVAINKNGAAPDPSAMLDVQSTEKGMLVPRMTQAQRDAISSPAASLLIYQTNQTPGFYFNAGTPASPNWQPVGYNTVWRQFGDDIYRFDGNIGIGLTSPAGKLHVSDPGEWLGITFTGTGPNDLTVDRSGYNGTGAAAYAIRIQNSGPVPNMIEISSDGGSTWSSPIPIVNPIAMGNGVTASFGSNAGHTFGDRWDWTVNESFDDVLVAREGKVGIGTLSPSALLHLSGQSGTDGIRFPDATLQTTAYLGGNTLGQAYNQGGPGAGRSIIAEDGAVKIEGTDGLLITGTIGNGQDIEASGFGTRMFFNPKKSAFRAGTAFSNEWNHTNVGESSVAFGEGTTASGTNSVAFGLVTNAPSAYEFALGVLNTLYTPASATEWNNNDRLFVIGNGTSLANRRDAMVLKKNGNMGIGISNPDHRLHVAGSIYSSSTNWAIRGVKTGTGTFPGVWGETESTTDNATGVRGFVLSTSPGAGSAGVHGRNFGTGSNGIGVKGTHDGGGWGVYGETVSGRGVYGRSTGTDLMTFAVGVYGEVDNDFIGAGIVGNATAQIGSMYGVYGISAANTGSALRAWATHTTGDTYGIYATVSSPNGYAGYFDGPTGSSNYFGRSVGIGVFIPGSFLLAVNGNAAKPGGGSWSSLSDERLKTIHGNYEKGLSEVLSLQPVRFNYLVENPLDFNIDEEQIGFVAQQVQHIFPEAVQTLNNGYLSFNMHAINVALVNSVKELSTIIEAQNARIEALENIIAGSKPNE